MRVLAIFFLLAGCGGLSWNTTVADYPHVRAAMLTGIEPGKTTEMEFRARWGNPTQKFREGAQIAYVYRNMSNPPGYLFPQFGESTAYVVVLFQYGVAIGAYSSDLEGCRATFAPRPPGIHYPNPATVKPVNCGALSGSDAGRDDMRDHAKALRARNPVAASGPFDAPLSVIDDSYRDAFRGKFR